MWQSVYLISIHIYCSFCVFFDFKWYFSFFLFQMKHKWCDGKFRISFCLRDERQSATISLTRSVTLSCRRYGKPENTRPQKRIMFQLHRISFTTASPQSLMKPPMPFFFFFFSLFFFLFFFLPPPLSMHNLIV